MEDKRLKYKALCLITACLESARIKYRLELADSHDFVMQKLDGSELKVQVEEGEGQNADFVRISLQTLLKGTGSEVNNLFLGLTSKAGYKCRAPINRGITPPLSPGRKSTRPYGDDHDRVIMRETVFRKVPDPTPEVYTELNPVIMTCVRFFYNANRKICLRLGYEIQDMKTYAQVWTANFWSTSRVLMPKTADENQKLLYRFLRQRFAEFYKQMITFRTRNVFANPVDQPEFDVPTTQPQLRTEDQRESIKDVDGQLVQKYNDRHAVLDTTTYKKRRDSAAALLKSGLESMDHDKLVETLEETSTSYFFCPDTRKEAVHQLKIHKKTCLTCAAIAAIEKNPLVADETFTQHFPLPLDEGKDLSVVDSGSGEEGSENAIAA